MVKRNEEITNNCTNLEISLVESESKNEKLRKNSKAHKKDHEVEIDYIIKEYEDLVNINFNM